MRNHKLIYLAIMILAILALAGCGKSESNKELDKYFAKIKSQKPPPIEPIPQLTPTPPAYYTASNLRSPFQPAIAQRPDQSRPKEVLEAFPLDSLHMVGILREGQKLWALVATPTNAVFRVTVGMHMGQNYGRVVAITSQEIKLVEQIPDGAGWSERTAELKIFKKT